MDMGQFWGEIINSYFYIKTLLEKYTDMDAREITETVASCMAGDEEVINFIKSLEEKEVQ